MDWRNREIIRHRSPSLYVLRRLPKLPHAAREKSKRRIQSGAGDWLDSRNRAESGLIPPLQPLFHLRLCAESLFLSDTPNPDFP